MDDTPATPSAMFFQGSLQDAISTAVGEQKAVLCFVTDDGQEGRLWEHDFLQDDALRDLLHSHAVALRLEKDSSSAGYLAQIFPLPQIPTVVVMRQGQLKEYIAPGASKEDFVRRVTTALSSPSPIADQPAAAVSIPSTTTAQSRQNVQAEPAPEPSSVSPAPERSENVARLLAERAARLQASKDESERKAKEERAAAKGKGKADTDAGRDTDAARAHQQANLVRRRREQEMEERRQILKRIEDDRAERRQRADSLGTGDVAASLVRAPETPMPSTTRPGNMASLQVRLLDGSTMRSRFPTTAPLADVRAWVDGGRTDGDAPYTFRQLLAPRTNHAIDTPEGEAMTLAELGLTPSSTLVLVPVRGYATAYEAAGPSAFLSSLLATVMAWMTWLGGLVGFGASFQRGEGTGATTAAQDQGTDGAQRRESRRIRGFDNLDDGGDQQLYNGNSLNFEPRPDEDDEKK